MDSYTSSVHRNQRMKAVVQVHVRRQQCKILSYITTGNNIESQRLSQLQLGSAQLSIWKHVTTISDILGPDNPLIRCSGSFIKDNITHRPVKLYIAALSTAASLVMKPTPNLVHSHSIPILWVRGEEKCSNSGHI